MGHGACRLRLSPVSELTVHRAAHTQNSVSQALVLIPLDRPGDGSPDKVSSWFQITQQAHKRHTHTHACVHIYTQVFKVRSFKATPEATVHLMLAQVSAPAPCRVFRI